MNPPGRPSPGLNGANRPLPTLQPAAPMLSIADIYYILFRHKWKIVICSLLGLIAGAAIHVTSKKATYLSEARLFVRFVISDKSTIGPAQDTLTKSPDQRGETIINSEIQILTSLDLAKKVAQAVGPEKLLGDEVPPDLASAALVISSGLKVHAPAWSSVLQITFEHENPEVVQPVVRELVDQYLRTHTEIHRATGMVGVFLSQETDQLRARLAQTEEELRKANAKAGVVSLESTKSTLAQQIAAQRDLIFKAEADLAAKKAVVERYVRQDQAPATPAEDAAAESTNTEPPAQPASTAVEPQIRIQYEQLLERVAQLRAKEQQLLTQFTAENRRVQETRDQILDAEGQRLLLEENHPELVAVVQTSTPNRPDPRASFDLEAEVAQLAALDSRIQILRAQMDQLRAEAAAVDQMEVSIMELRRRKELEEANYRRYASSLEQSRISEALGAGAVSNITQIQSPSPPIPLEGETKKTAGMLALGGIGLGLAWAALIEFYLDRTIRRPIDVTRQTQHPLFLTIPRINALIKSARRKGDPAQAALPQPVAVKGASEASLSDGATTAALTPVAVQAELQPFCDTLRDRLIGFFESRGLTHKPKLIAVTSLGHQAGVTTTAAGLASSLSVVGDGNVLLIDLTPGHGASQQFYRGKAVCGIDEMLLERGAAQVQDNLFVAAENGENDAISRVLPQRFNRLVPKLKASNFDFIIFDTPPISQISITPRLASYMDLMLVVAESEKTDSQVFQKATSLLSSSKAQVGVVLNKTRQYVPKRLHHDALEAV